VTETDLDLLKNSVDKVVRVVCRDGETMLVKVHFVSDDERDLIYDRIVTETDSNFEEHNRQPAFLIRFEDIEHVESV
jgi:small nuclear ribonucleoprotein (snRNP)-like protein